MDYKDKNEKLIRESAKLKTPILCSDHSHAVYLKQFASDMGVTMPDPICGACLVKPEGMEKLKKMTAVLVYDNDNAAVILKELFRNLNVEVHFQFQESITL